MITAMTAPKRKYLRPCSDIAAIPLTAGQANCTALRIPLSQAQCHVTLVTEGRSRKVAGRGHRSRRVLLGSASQTTVLAACLRLACLLSTWVPGDLGLQSAVEPVLNF